MRRARGWRTSPSRSSLQRVPGRQADAARLNDALRERPEAIMDRVFAARHDPARVRAPIPVSCVAESTAVDFRRYFCRGFLGVAGCNW
jgi:hypothetical protein